jgi:hypothetical protein
MTDSDKRGPRRGNSSEHTTLPETNPDPLRFTPNEMTGPLRTLRLDDQRKVVGDSRQAFDFETSAGRRDVAHNAIDGTGLRERNRGAFKDPASWGPAVFHGETLGLVNYKHVKLETNRA